MKKVFISHSHKDSFYAEKMITILREIGILPKQIICTSVKPYGVDWGKNFLDEIKNWLTDDVVVIFLFSQNYFNSTYSQCEMGACWVSAKHPLPILIPPFKAEDVEGVFMHNQAYSINRGIDLSIIKKNLEKIFQIENKIEAPHWDAVRENILPQIENYINSNGNSDLNDKNSILDSDSKNIEPKENGIEKQSTKVAPSLLEKLELVEIQPGSFKRFFDDKEISVSDHYSISRYLVTQDLFENILGYNPSDTRGAQLPVESVSFFQALEFCNTLSEKLGFEKIYSWNEEYEISINETAKGIRLPTECEWDHALEFQKKFIENNFDSMGWHNENSQKRIKKVGLKPDNPKELYDMIGNVWEWCFDTYTEFPSYENYYKNLINIKERHARVLKGGSCLDSDSTLLRTNFRTKLFEKSSEVNCGFRIVLQNSI